MECQDALNEFKGFASFLIMVGTAAGVWAVVDISLGNRIEKLKAQQDRGVLYCPLHKGDRVDCERMHK